MAEPVGRTARRPGAERKPREERWAELLDVATEVFYQKGYEGASLQEIADRIGILKGSLYYYIQSKEDLLYEVIKEVHEKGLAVVKALAGAPTEPLERLEDVIKGHVEHTCHNLISTAVFLHELSALPPGKREQIIGDDHSYRGVFRELIDEAARNGDIRDDVDPRLAVLSILGSTNWAYRWFQPGGEFSVSLVAAQLAATAIRGIATDAALRARQHQLDRGGA